jgi:hypothetical protein
MQDVHQETWLIFYDDIRVGTIAERAGVPLRLLSEVGPARRIRSGTAATFKLAREAFGRAWRLPADLYRTGFPRVPTAAGQRSMETCHVGCPCAFTDADRRRPIALLLRR